MFHSNTELLQTYWRSRRRGHAPPARADIDLADFFQLAAQVFLAVRDDAGVYRFRLAGETVNGLHGRSLAGEDLLAVWRPAHRPLVADILGSTLAAGDIAVLRAAAGEAEPPVRLEVVFAPLRSSGGAVDLFLGLYQPLSPFPGLAGLARRELAVERINGEAAAAPRPLRLAVLDGRPVP
ncbi:MAG: PAS domain-containing protein [Caulobacteraceae bacterium]|nr:PAS domain-containing protein [Caulobacteraceae bacterium]